MIDDYAIEMYGITKIFNEKVFANRNINLKIKKGEIHTLLGENGAGKSTLMSILSGIYKPTFGHIKINGKKVVIENSSIAKQLGIGMIYQHFKIVDNFTVWENIALSSESKKIFLNKKNICKKINWILEKYNFSIDLNKKASDLTVSELQKVEIVKVLYNNSDIFVFDEPTAVLIKDEITQFLDILLNLKAKGKTIIFISHKLDEVKKISDNISILRNGQLIDTFPNKNKSISEIANLMVGRKIVEIKNNYKNIKKEQILKIENLFVRNSSKVLCVKDMNLTVNAGEIVAVAGVDNNGQTELLESISGLNKNYEGNIIINNIDVKKIPTNKIYNFLSYIPEDRIKNGLALNLNVLDNILLQNLYTKPFVNNLGFLNREANIFYSQNIIKNYNVKGTANGYAPISNLSGGNQQKILVGREITKQHNLILISNPTRGIDLGAIEYIHQKILEEKKNGNAILLVSTELDEIITLADRVIVISAGTKKGELVKEYITKENIGILMLKENGKDNEQITT